MFCAVDTPIYRIVFAEHVDSAMQGAIHFEGRFHHDGQPALYASPSPEAAAIAIDIYRGPKDPPRVIVPLHLCSARFVDLRDSATCAELGVDPTWPSVPWADERAAGMTATSWRASDAARNAGAYGMIYSSRRAPDRWHVVLFSWDSAPDRSLRLAGTPVIWEPVR